MGTSPPTFREELMGFGLAKKRLEPSGRVEDMLRIGPFIRGRVPHIQRKAMGIKGRILGLREKLPDIRARVPDMRRKAPVLKERVLENPEVAREIKVESWSDIKINRIDQINRLLNRMADLFGIAYTGMTIIPAYCGGF